LTEQFSRKYNRITNSFISTVAILVAAWNWLLGNRCHQQCLKVVTYRGSTFAVASSIMRTRLR